MKRFCQAGIRVLLVGLCLSGSDLFAASTNVLVWSKEKDRVTADVRDWDLLRLLSEVASQTGWHVFVEPDASFKASVKFKELPSGQALRALLGDLNYAFVPQTNATQQLYVFRTSLKNATQSVLAAGRKDAGKPKRVPNELIVRVKPGTDVDQLARLFGAKITGRIPELNIYRFQFPDDESAAAAKKLLADSAGVDYVDYNYYFDAPQPTREYRGDVAPKSPSLQLKPPGNSDRVIVGLIDTPVQPLGGNLDAFLLKQLSVVGDYVLDPSSPMHGTSMAESVLFGLQSLGNESSVGILPVNVYEIDPITGRTSEQTTTWNVVLGIIEAVNKGANPINLSLAGPEYSPALYDVISSATKRGIVVIAAAGNTPDPSATFPASQEDVLAVSGGNQQGISSYAKKAGFVDIVAPDSTIVTFNNRSWYVVGTSVSSAFVSGVMAGLGDNNGRNWPNAKAVVLRSFPVPTATK